MKKGLLFATVISVVFFTSCGSSKKVVDTTEEVEVVEAVVVKEEPKAPVPVPEGYDFQLIENAKGFAKINVPLTGKGFKTSYYGEANVLPEVRYGQGHFSMKSSVSDDPGNFQQMFDILAPKLAMRLNDRTTVTIDEMKIGDFDVARVDVVEKTPRGYMALNYGYLIKHGDKTASLFHYHAEYSPSQVDAKREQLDIALQYMIKTVEFE